MAEQAQQTIKLELTIDEVNAILASLGKHPLKLFSSWLIRFNSRVLLRFRQQKLQQMLQQAL